MAIKCASNYSCGRQVEVNGYWCTSCQDQASRSAKVGDLIFLALVDNLEIGYQPALLNCTSEIVRAKLAQRDDLDPRVRRQLLRDADQTVVFIAARSRDNSPEDLYRLLKGAGAELLMVLASHPNVPLRGLRLLAGHPDKRIAERAKTTFLSVYQADASGDSARDDRSSTSAP